MATNPTFFTDYEATVDHVSETNSVQTEIASGTYEWGIGTKANIVSGAGARWGALSNVWTDPNNWTLAVVAKPDATKVGDASQVLALADSGGSYLLVSFFGDYASGGSGSKSFAAIHYKSGSFRRGGFTTGDVCDGNDHVFIARRTGATFQIFVDGVEVPATALTIGTATLAGATTTPSLHCSGTYGSIAYFNRQAPIGLVKFYNEALSDADIAALSADPWETGGAADATADGGTGTGLGAGTGGDATGATGGDATATGGTGTGTGAGSGGDAMGVSSGSFTSSPMYSSGILQVSVALDWTWYPGAIGAAPTSALVHGSGATSAAGTLTMPGLPVGDGFYLAEGVGLSGEQLIALEYGTVT